MDANPQSAQVREQNRVLTKRIEQLERRLRRLEKQPRQRPPLAAARARPADPPAAGYGKALASVAAGDGGSLTRHGITVYGTVDTGLTYQTHATPLNQDVGLGYLISKNSNKPYFGVAPNALSASNIGVKGDEELLAGLHGVFNLQTSFMPTSGQLFDGLGSIVQNNGVPGTAQTTFADSHPLAAGTGIIGGYSLGTANNAAFTDNRILQVFWTSAKYAVRSDLDLMIGYYRETQNSFSGNGSTNASLPQCSGQLNAFSAVADYRFAKHWDAYAGAMYSHVSNGLASGFAARSTVDPTVGARFQF